MEEQSLISIDDDGSIVVHNPFGGSITLKYGNEKEVALRLRMLGDAKGDALAQAIANRRQEMPEENPDTVLMYFNFATELANVGEYHEAKLMLVRLVEAGTGSLGADHRAITMGYSNLALILQQEGDYDAAKALLEDTADFYEKKFGPDHSATAFAYFNLASILRDTGDYNKAKVLVEKAIHAQEIHFGPEHPNVALSYSYLASIFKDLQQYETALGLAEKALGIFRRTLPEGHEYITTAITNYESIKKASL